MSLEQVIDALSDHEQSDTWRLNDDGFNTVWVIDREIADGPDGVKADELTHGDLDHDTVEEAVAATEVDYQMRVIKDQTQLMFTLAP